MTKPTPTTREIFTAEELAGHDPRNISFLLASKAYNEFWIPLLTGLMQKSLAQLADPTLPRKVSSNYLRGYIAACRAILNAPIDILESQNRKNREDDSEVTASQQYEEIARTGRGPFGPSQIAVSPTDPI